MLDTEDDAGSQARLTDTGVELACDVCGRSAESLHWNAQAETWTAACARHVPGEHGLEIMDLAGRFGTCIVSLCESDDTGAQLVALARWLGEDGAWVLDRMRTPAPRSKPMTKAAMKNL
jgi:hypothetical protein